MDASRDINETQDPFAASPHTASLYSRMMLSIKSGHSLGNTVRMVKVCCSSFFTTFMVSIHVIFFPLSPTWQLPLIFTEADLYAGAIGQFWALSSALETALDKNKSNDMVCLILSMGLSVTSGFESDLACLLGPDWRKQLVLTEETKEYVELLGQASPARLVSASFIIYGALVVGGGRATQARVRHVFPDCEHLLYDVAIDMKLARKAFKSTFDEIGKTYPDHFQEIQDASAEFMGHNNSVIFSIPCVGRKVVFWSVAVAVGFLGAVVAFKSSVRR
jgi:hypothetical protein